MLRLTKILHFSLFKDGHENEPSSMSKSVSTGKCPPLVNCLDSAQMHSLDSMMQAPLAKNEKFVNPSINNYDGNLIGDQLFIVSSNLVPNIEKKSINNAHCVRISNESYFPTFPFRSFH